MRLPLAAALLLAATSAQAMEHHVDSPQWTRQYDESFQKYSKHFFGPFFDWRWFKAQAIVESSLDPDAESPAGAVGVMQLKPSTFNEIRRAIPELRKIRHATWNIAAAIYYDHYLYQRQAWSKLEHEERLQFALAAYNAGPTGVLRAFNRTPPTVKSWAQVAPNAPPETRRYVVRINAIRSGGSSARRTPALRGVAAQFEARRQAAARMRASLID